MSWERFLQELNQHFVLAEIKFLKHRTWLHVFNSLGMRFHATLEPNCQVATVWKAVLAPSSYSWPHIPASAPTAALTLLWPQQGWEEREKTGKSRRWPAAHPYIPTALPTSTFHCLHPHHTPILPYWLSRNQVWLVHFFWKTTESTHNNIQSLHFCLVFNQHYNLITI